MAIARGNESKEAQEFKRYIGVAPVFIKAINPDKKEHEALFNTTLEEAPKYVETKEDKDGKSYKNVRIQIVFKPDTEKIGFEMPLVTMALFLQDTPRVGGDSGGLLLKTLRPIGSLYMLMVLLTLIRTTGLHM